MTAMPRQRKRVLRSAAFALVASGMCNACSQPAPPPAATPTDTTDAATAPPATPPPGATTTAPVPESPDPVAESPAAQAPTPMPTPSKPAATPAPAPTPPPPANDAQPTQIVVTMLSRGKGVPTETRDAYKQIRYVLEQQQAKANVTALQASRIGLEGETRLCAEFRNREDAQPALAEIRKLAAGVDLLNVVEEPCPSRKVDKP